ncbi:MAG: ribosome hibernation-promoting factor, HPF/YfiA family [Culicoidibacterales bacterium]
MKVTIRGHKIEVTQAQKQFIEEKLAKLEKYFTNKEEVIVNVLIKQYDFQSRVEVAIHAEKYVLRADERQNDIYAAVDVVLDKLERQIRKHKTKLNKKIKERVPMADAFFVESETPDEIKKVDIIKEKKIELRPMDVEEAILQLQLIDHDFYFFLEADTNKPMVVYKRKEGQFGIIQGE